MLATLLLCNSAVIYDFIGLAPTGDFVGTAKQEVGAATGFVGYLFLEPNQASSSQISSTFM